MIQAIGVVLALLILSTKLPKVVSWILWLLLLSLVVSKWNVLSGIFKK